MMAEKKLEVRVRTKGTRQAEKQIKNVDNRLKSLGKTALVTAGSFFAARGLIRGISTLISKAGQQELAEKKLEAALGRTSQALLDHASALQQVTMYGDETILEAQAMLAAFIKDEEQLKLATQATLDLAAAKGFDLVAAADLVGKSVGSSTNALTRYGIEVKGAVGSQERLNSLVENTARLFAGQATAQAQTMTGALEQMKNAVGDTAEVIGDLLAPSVIRVAKFLKSAAESASAFFKGMTETTLESTIRELREAGQSTLEFELALARAATAKAKIPTIGLEGEEELTKRIVQHEERRVGFLTDLANQQRLLLESGATEEELRGKIADWQSIISLGARETGIAVQREARASLDAAQARLQNIDSLIVQIEEQEKAKDLTEEQLLALQKYGAELERIAAIQAAMEAPPPIEPPSTDLIEEYAKFVSNQEKRLDAIKKEEEFTKRLIEEYPEMAKQLGIMTSETKDFAQWTQNASSSLVSAGFAGRNIADSIKMAITQLVIMIAQAKLYKLIMESAALAQLGPAGIAIAGIKNILGFQRGGDFIVTKPQIIMVGEKGPEHIMITPGRESPIFNPNILMPKQEPPVFNPNILMPRQERPVFNLQSSLNVPKSEKPQTERKIEIHIHGGIIDESYVRNELKPVLDKIESM